MDWLQLTLCVDFVQFGGSAYLSQQIFRLATLTLVNYPVEKSTYVFTVPCEDFGT